MNEHAEPTGGNVVRLADVSRRFGGTVALESVSLTVRKGEILGIIGRSGAGKSTLIRCLNGLERPDSGRIEIEGHDITALREAALRPLRRRIGMIFQHFNLLSAKTVEENIALPLKIEGWSKAKRLERATELLDLVGLKGRGKSYPAQLSGGQKQRVGIARALAANPALLLSDEATSALDPETTRSILALLKDINRKLGLTILLITHEMEVVRSIADRVVVLDVGRVVEEGPVSEVFSQPVSSTAKSLLATARPQLPGHVVARLTRTPSGGEAVLGVDVAGEAATGELLQALASASTSYRLLQGGVEHIQDQPVGRFFFSVQSDDVVAVTDAVVRLGAKVEVLGHVADHA